MKFKVLDKVLKLLDGECVNGVKVLDSKFDLNKVGTEFKNELDLNLLSLETTEGKRDMLKHYIFEFTDLSYFYGEHGELMEKRSFSLLENDQEVFYSYNQENIPEKLNLFESYLVKSNDAFCFFFSEIQIACRKFGVDFFEICDDLDFPLDYVDTGLSIYYKKRQEEKRSNLKKEASKNNNERPKTFEEMFPYPELIQGCIDVLKKVEPRILSDHEQYIGKHKAAFCIWVDKMKSKGLINHYSDRKIYATLISEKFSPFSIDESMFGKVFVRARKIYQLDFDTLLSQVSQKGRPGK